ncbi:MAG: ABC transporter ATP-binding protein [Lachnospiraceae bacterium]|nr:ABC transporter ATP-binding protein [Lachnospiraceae bacterium]
MGNILEIKNLTKYYGDVLGVKNLSLELREGEIFGFIGPNGAGKSTTIRSVMHLINKTSGSVFVNGKEFLKNDTETKKLIGFLPGEVYLYDDLKVGQILDYHESFFKNSVNAQAIHEKRVSLCDRLKLDESKKIEDLSLGNLKKTGIILALMHMPKLIIMDEPTSGLDPIMQNVFYDLLLEEKARGNTVFYSTHILNEVSKICDRVGIIRNGQLVKVEKTSELSDKNLTFVTVKSRQADDILADLGVKNLNLTETAGNTTKSDLHAKSDIPSEGSANAPDKGLKTDYEMPYSGAVAPATIRFANPLPDGELVKRLSAYDIEKIRIEEATLEELFMHYYTEE